MTRLLTEVAQHLRSVSRENMLKLGGFLHRLLWHGWATEAESAWWATATVDERWKWLKGLDAHGWLSLYDARTATASLCYTLFKRQIRWLRTLHAQVLHGDGQRSVTTFPMPRACGRLLGGGGGGSDEGSSSASSGTTTSSMGDDDSPHAREQRLRCRDQLFRIQERVCRPRDRLADADRQYSFTPTEVRRIVQAAWTALERLVVMIFLQTGLRIGGVARLQLSTTGGGGGSGEQQQQRTVLTTIEKNAKLRRVVLPAACSRLLDDWLVVRGRGRPGPWVFPSDGRHGAAASVHRNWVWRVCRTVFRRAGVTGPHVHPHTFRHTVASEASYIFG